MTAAFRAGWEAAQATVKVSESGHVVILSNQGQTSQLGQLLQPRWRKKAYLPLVLARGPVDRESAQRPSRQPTGRPFGGGAARDVLLLRDGPKLSHVMMRAAWVSDRCRLCPWRRDGWLERSVERGRWQGLGADDERAQEDHREEDGDYPGEEEVWVEHALVESLCPPGHPELRAKEYMCRGRVLRVAVGGRSGTPKRQKKADPSPAPPNHNSTFGSSS